MLDRNFFIEYRKVSKETIKMTNINSTICEAEQYALRAREASRNGNTSLSHRIAVKAIESFVANPMQHSQIKDIQTFALALGKMMEGDNFSENDMILKAVAISYYYLTKAIKECSNNDPYLFVYRFSIAYEYNKAFYHLFAHSQGKEIPNDPTELSTIYSLTTYNHHLQVMQMCDMFMEPRVGKLDNALNNIFYQIISEYSDIDPSKVMDLGNKYHDQLYNYISGKISNNDLSF